MGLGLCSDIIVVADDFGSGCGHGFRCFCGVEQATSDLVSDLFREAFWQVVAHLLYDGGRSGDEVDQQRFSIRSIADGLGFKYLISR
ncbi:hypothetical protein ACTOWA_11635 [Herbaspirillum seropedicae]|uniref:hypothetical protein n=1 Tax=Herbaspirillum seropedicae TaxID=964 RepID=UPI003F8D506F